MEYAGSCRLLLVRLKALGGGRVAFETTKEGVRNFGDGDGNKNCYFYHRQHISAELINF